MSQSSVRTSCQRWLFNYFHHVDFEWTNQEVADTDTLTELADKAEDDEELVSDKEDDELEVEEEEEDEEDTDENKLL